MAVSADQVARQAEKLLPRGTAWRGRAGRWLYKLLLAASDELARLFGRAEDLLAEAHPNTIDESLEDWERELGLPDECGGDDQTVDQRKAVVVAKLTNLGGQSRAHFIALAANLGYVITIDEFFPFVAGSHAGDLVTGVEWVFTWRVNAPMENLTTFKVGANTVGQPLRTWGSPVLECEIAKYRPAHTTVQFAYFEE